MKRVILMVISLIFIYTKVKKIKENMSMNLNLLTVEDIAQKLGLGKTTVYKMIKKLKKTIDDLKVKRLSDLREKERLEKEFEDLKAEIKEVYGVEIQDFEKAINDLNKELEKYGFLIEWSTTEDRVYLSRTDKQITEFLIHSIL